MTRAAVIAAIALSCCTMDYAAECHAAGGRVVHVESYLETPVRVCIGADGRIIPID
jgi:hypothetical protein